MSPEAGRGLRRVIDHAEVALILWPEATRGELRATLRYLAQLAHWWEGAESLGAGRLSCARCGGTRVQLAMWVDVNTSELGELLGGWSEAHHRWCKDCGAHVALRVLPDGEEG